MTSNTSNWVISTDPSVERARVARLNSFNSQPGILKSRLSDVAASIPDDDFLFTVGYSDAIAAVRKNGDVYSHGDVVAAKADNAIDATPGDGAKAAASEAARLDLRPWVNTRHPAFGTVNVDGAPPAGAVPLNKRVGDLAIHCGVVLIVAGGGAGKTPLAHALAASGVESYSVARVGEPLAGYTRNSRGAARALARAMYSCHDVVLDSIKDLLSAGGAAMKSGLSRDALVTVSGWASLACELGRTIYVPVNPSTPDPAVLELLGEIARSNATMTIVAKGNNEWSYASRTGEGLERVAGVLSTRFRDGRMTIEGTEPQKMERFRESMSSVLDASSLNPSVWTRAQRRALTPE